MKSLLGNLLILLLFFSCTKPEKKEIKFKIPVIYQNGIRGKFILHKSDSLGEVWPIFINKFKFDDSIKTITKYFNKEFGCTTRFLCNKNSINKKDVFQEYEYVKDNDTLSTDGFQIFADYKTNIFYNNYDNDSTNGNCYYPIYIINETTKSKVFILKDDYVFALQESKDSNKRWRPIECRGFDWCGNGYWGLKILPGEFVMFLLPKYEGPNKSAMRVRLSIGENIYISNTFKGSFNYNQFYLSKKALRMQFESLREYPLMAYNHWFYYAIPKELED